MGNIFPAGQEEELVSYSLKPTWVFGGSYVGLSELETARRMKFGFAGPESAEDGSLVIIALSKE